MTELERARALKVKKKDLLHYSQAAIIRPSPLAYKVLADIKAAIKQLENTVCT